jgi:hypothetical protein
MHPPSHLHLGLEKEGNNTQKRRKTLTRGILKKVVTYLKLFHSPLTACREKFFKYPVRPDDIGLCDIFFEPLLKLLISHWQ